jgi:hypothetical protein
MAEHGRTAAADGRIVDFLSHTFPVELWQLRYFVAVAEELHSDVQQRAFTCRAYVPRTLTARAATSSSATTEISDSRAIRAFAERVRGIVSVALNAIPFVKAT